MGTRSASSELKLTFQSTIKNLLDNNDSATATISGTLLSGKINDGVSASQANRALRATGEAIVSGNTTDIDLYDFAGFDLGAGAGLDALGQTLALEEIVTLIIKQSGGAGRLEIMPTSPATALAWVPSLTVANGGALKNGGVFMMHQPDTDAFDVQDGVSHVLRLGANGGDVEFDLYILARHDDDESSSSSSSSSNSSSSTSSSQSSLSTSTSLSSFSSSSTSVTSTRSWTSYSSSSSTSP